MDAINLDICNKNIIVRVFILKHCLHEEILERGMNRKFIYYVQRRILCYQYTR